MKVNRIKEISNYIREHENASIDTLCSIFNVSKNTIRRDIAELEEKGIIKKVYGGITLNIDEKDTIPFNQREIKNKDIKVVLAELASNLVEDNDIIFIDSGTTTVHMIPFLANRRNLTIITNNLNVLVMSLDYPNLNVLSTGGSLFREANSFIGIEAIHFLNNYNIGKAFMASTGVSISNGITNSSSFEYQIKKTVVQKSNKIIVLADSSKLDVASLMTYCDLKDIDALVTDNILPEAYYKFFKDNHIDAIIPTK